MSRSASYTVKELSKLSGVSVRTLHFYDEIGLLKPASVGENGYRYYEREQLLLLQQILFYRELGFPLEEIKKVLSSAKFDKIQALTRHRDLLKKDAARLKELLRTIDRTIADLKGDEPMKDPKGLYQGFSPEKQAEYEKFISERYGDKHLRESKKRTKGWKKEDFERIQKGWDELHRLFTDLIQTGASPEDERTQDVVQKHYEFVKQFWTPNQESYSGLGRLYVEHPDFRKLYDSYHPKLADFLAESMRVFATSRLR